MLWEGVGTTCEKSNLLGSKVRSARMRVPVITMEPLQHASSSPATLPPDGRVVRANPGSGALSPRLSVAGSARPPGYYWSFEVALWRSYFLENQSDAAPG
jgi:hypothetical protein